MPAMSQVFLAAGAIEQLCVQVERVSSVSRSQTDQTEASQRVYMPEGVAGQGLGRVYANSAQLWICIHGLTTENFPMVT